MLFYYSFLLKPLFKRKMKEILLLLLLPLYMCHTSSIMALHSFPNFVALLVFVNKNDNISVGGGKNKV